MVSSQDPARPASRLLCLPWYMEYMLLHILCTAAAGSRTCMPPLPTSPPLSMDPTPSHVPNQPGGFSHCGMDPRLHIGVVYYAVYVCIPAVEAVAQYLCREKRENLCQAQDVYSVQSRYVLCRKNQPRVCVVTVLLSSCTTQSYSPCQARFVTVGSTDRLPLGSSVPVWMGMEGSILA